MSLYKAGYTYANVLPVGGSPLTATASSPAIPIPEERKCDQLAVNVQVSAATGTTPSLTVSVQWSNDGVTFSDNDSAADAFGAITAAKNTVKQFPIKGRWFRVTYTITGTTPSFTLTASAFSS